MRPLLIDLFCGVGAAGMGYHRAGFRVVGVDIAPQPRYPFEFVQADALDSGLDLEAATAIHASPPCQRWTNLQKRNGNGDFWPDLVTPARQILKASGQPYVIENVVGAPLHQPIKLCGSMFDGLRVYRHRLFESNLPLVAPRHGPHRRLCYTMDKRKPHYGQLDEWKDFVQVNGGGNCSKAAAADAMGIDWAGPKRELNEAIPPAYTQHIGAQILAILAVVG